MRRTARPVSLARLLSTIWAFDEGGIETVSGFCKATDSPQGRGREILSEVQATGFLDDVGRRVRVTRSGHTLLMDAKDCDYASIHGDLLAHPHYSLFHEVLRQREPPITPREILRLAGSTNDTISLNATGLHVTGEWSERCGSAQRSLQTSAWFPTSMSTSPSWKEADSAIRASYTRLDRQKGQFFRKRFVEIPLLREEVSRSLSVHRSRVDDLLRTFYKAHMGNCEIAGAPILSHAKVSRFKIRRLLEPKDFETFRPAGESWTELPALTWKNKQYYFFAIHGGSSR